MFRLYFIGLFILISGSMSLKAEAYAFEFYGVNVTGSAPQSLQNYQFNNQALSFEKVSSQLTAMHRTGLTESINELRQNAEGLNLDDLGYFQLLKMYSQKVYPAQSVAFRIALVWYGLRQHGIDAILAGKNDYLNLFVAMEQVPDGGFSMTHRGRTYYSVTKGKIPYPALEVYRLQLLQDSALGSLSLNTDRLPELGNRIESRKREFSYARKQYTLHTRYNANLVSYLNDLPRFRVGTHLYELNPSGTAAKSIDDSLVVWMAGMDKQEKMSFLLAMVQGAFPYKADRDYREHEKRNFVEQTLADDFTDCEDKAAFFCYLSRKYLNANTILIYSKENVHVNCAIEMNQGAPGYTFKYNNRPWLICEPAYIGYKPGETDMSMTDFKKSEIFE